ncbi:hypothetical protein [Wenzhouxiangella sp. EGI_FJ10305]|uniref:hypothetical protein n=1 Tax=Wenzhouxiangella sp. EGI_FJ10305 TaxID=3243768 RepID=UPI0035D6E1F1
MGIAAELVWINLARLPIVGAFPVIVTGALASLLLYVLVSLMTPPDPRDPALDDPS